MNAFRLILLILLVWILWRFAQKWYQNFQQNYQNNEPKPPQPTTETHYAIMVQCDYCGIHLPQEEAINSANGLFCSEAHKRAAQQS